MNSDMMEALQALAADRGISTDTLLMVLADAMQSAYEKMPDAHDNAWVTINPETGEFRVMAQDTDEDYNPEGPEYDVTPADFGRIAAVAFKHVMSQKIREAERELKYEEYANREGDIVTGIIQQSDARYTLVDLGRVEALMPQSEQVAYERSEPGKRVKAYIVEVRRTAKGPQIVVSRTHPGLIKRLFELEVPEIADGVVEIRACAREPGQRTKIAVWSNDSNIDPIGACVGARGSRVRMVTSELGGEKIDIVQYSDDLEDFVAKALQPARVTEVRIDYDSGTAEVIVPDFQLSLAIGKEGQNARLAHRLVGLRIDIRSETDAAAEAAGQDWAEGEWITDPETGEQMWQPADGGPAISAAEWSGDEVAVEVVDVVAEAEIDAVVAEVEAEIDAEIEAEVEAEVEAEIDAEIEAEVEAEVEAEIEAEIDAEIDAAAAEVVAEAQELADTADAEAAELAAEVSDQEAAVGEAAVESAADAVDDGLAAAAADADASDSTTVDDETGSDPEPA